jgi:hypothetical protein
MWMIALSPPVPANVVAFHDTGAFDADRTQS